MSQTVKKNMPYVRLGKSGLKVSKVILGLMSYGSKEWAGWVLGEEEGLEHIKFAYDAGIQTFDTANTYSNGLSEVILGKAIKKYNLPRDEIVVMTKVNGAVAKTYDKILWWPWIKPDEEGYVNQHGLSRKHIFEAVKHSLERLQLDYIDVLQCHRFNYNTPIEETMQALHDVVQAGYVRYIGMSSCHAWQFHVMQNYAINNNLTPFISMQNHYSLLYREEEREMMPTLKHFGVASIPWWTLGQGLLTRPYVPDANADAKKTQRESTDVFLQLYDIESGCAGDIIKRVEEVAKKKGVSMAQVALAWVLAKEPVCAPIVGSTKLEYLKDLIDGVNLKLTEEEMKYLEEPYVPQKVVGHT